MISPIRADCRGRKIYEPPRYMSIPQAVLQLLEIEDQRNSGTLSAEKTLAIGMSRVGGGEENQRIVCGTLAELANHPSDAFGEPLHSLVVVGKRLHPLEVEFTEDFAINRSTWRSVAKNIYGCALD
jgi:diphthine methyl ester synthase